MCENWRDSSEMKTVWSAAPPKIGKFYMGFVRVKCPFFPAMAGDEKWLTEAFFTLISEDWEKQWFPSVVLRANKDFLAMEPTPRDKCFTEGYSPSCVILMICSRHIPIFLVVHEALWHSQCSALSVRAIHHFSAGHNDGTQIKRVFVRMCSEQRVQTTHWSYDSLNLKYIYTNNIIKSMREIQSTLILQFIKPKRIYYTNLLILKWSCEHATK